MAKILLAEDDDFLRQMTRTILESAGHSVSAFVNGQLALEEFEHVDPDIVVSDINMPILDGFGLLDGVRRLPGGSVVPFLFLSARSEHADVMQARRLGADDYLFKPYVPGDLLDAVENRLRRHQQVLGFATASAHIQTIKTLMEVVEGRDHYTRGHLDRVEHYALSLGRALGWAVEDLFVLEYGAALHDIGKLMIPDEILNKPGRLTAEEMRIMRDHTLYGEQILKGVEHLQGAIPYAKYHHERWDGSGYPEGLAGRDIPREARLLALTDVYDAITTARAYHREAPHQAALTYIREQAGKHFDPEMAELFIRLRAAELGPMPTPEEPAG